MHHREGDLVPSLVTKFSEGRRKKKRKKKPMWWIEERKCGPPHRLEGWVEIRQTDKGIRNKDGRRVTRI